MKVFGVAGWKNTGKTGLVERLVSELTSRGLSVSTIKHAHHRVDVDQQGTDSYRHRQAGACEVVLASANRFALMHELRGADEPELEDLLAKMSPVDLVLVEGYKSAPHPKIETYRAAAGQALLAKTESSIRAVASDSSVQVDVPVFDLNDTSAIADFILRESGL
ncbi:MAG: molybdopterin-guanine dinucleotide biosynthesis protein B [Pseudomonadota bacterium]